MISYPKHIRSQQMIMNYRFRFLHAAPSDLMEEGLFEKQCSYDVTSEMDEKAKKILGRKHRRVTFLVNIWLNYKPFNVNPFPETMIEKLSKVDLFGEFRLFGKESNAKDTDGGPNEIGTKSVLVCDGNATIRNTLVQANNKGDDSSGTDNDVKLTKIKWPMGENDEEWISVLVPAEVIQSQQKTGCDVAITWNDGVILGGTGT